MTIAKSGGIALAIVLACVATLALLAVSSSAKNARNPQPTPGCIDISVLVDPDTTPVYPGNASPKFTVLHSFDKGEKFTLSMVEMGDHTGTHIDAPLHFIEGGATIDQVPASKLTGRAQVIEVSKSAKIVDAAELNLHQWRGAKKILFKTRSSYDNFWADKEFHKDFVGIAPDAAQLLADAGVDLVGIDYLSAEQFGAPAPLTHRTLLGKGIVIVEGLDLRQVSAGNYELTVLPLRLKGLEAAPARAILQPQP
jgi:arylformamidase